MDGSSEIYVSSASQIREFNELGLFLLTVKLYETPPKSILVGAAVDGQIHEVYFDGSSRKVTSI